MSRKLRFGLPGDDGTTPSFAFTGPPPGLVKDRAGRGRGKKKGLIKRGLIQ